MAELQIDSVALQRDILVRQNENESTGVGKKARNGRLLEDSYDRWESSREADAEQTKKPLIGYEEWRAIESRYTEAERTRSHLEGQRAEENVARWTDWQESDTVDQWQWLADLGIPPPGDDRCWEIALKSLGKTKQNRGGRGRRTA